jgi:hypothetical protein
MVQKGLNPYINLNVAATLARDAAAYVSPTLNVVQFDIDGVLNWINPAGYTLTHRRHLKMLLELAEIPLRI